MCVCVCVCVWVGVDVGVGTDILMLKYKLPVIRNIHLASNVSIMPWLRLKLTELCVLLAHLCRWDVISIIITSTIQTQDDGFHAVQNSYQTGLRRLYVPLMTWPIPTWKVNGF